MRALTYAPLPDWVILAKVLFPVKSSPNELAAPWCRSGERPFWFSRSAWSLLAIAKLHACVIGTRTPCFWVPDFFCNSSLGPLRELGARFVFYPLAENLEPDYRACRELANAARPDIFLLVHYFGLPVKANQAAQFCGHYRAWLVEDAAHVILPTRGVGETGDFVLYSPHKLLPIPDGAVLVARANGPGLKHSVQAHMEPLSRVHESMVGPGFAHTRSSLLWLLKRVLQKLGWRSAHGSSDAFHADPPAAPLGRPVMSQLSRKLLSVMGPSLWTIANARHLRWQILNQLLADHTDLRCIPASDEVAESVPYVARFAAIDVKHAETWFGRLAAMGFPVTSWPDLPPEVIRDRASHPRTWQQRQQTLYLHVHHSLPVAQLVDRFPSPATSTAESERIRIVWDEASESEWEKLIRRAGRSNLLQSWSYGEAKRQCEGWQVHRGVFLRDERPVAIAQVLCRRYLGVIRVYRINRGPLFIGEPSEAEVLAILRLVRGQSSWWRGRFVSIAPELERTASTAVLLARIGYRALERSTWSSSWIDLAPDLASVRTNLDGKWRNMLTVSEKQGLTLEVGDDDALFEWLTDCYLKLMDQKNFSGIPLSILRVMRSRSGPTCQLMILRAAHDRQPVAGICVGLHGAAATYLVGWNGDTGRKLKANQFLLWNAIALLKQQGYRWFDLGGIDTVRTPGVAEFKLGLNGMRYTLAGEYYCG